MKYIYGIIAIVLIGLLIYVLWPRTELKDINVTQFIELQTKLQRAENKRTEIILKARQDSVLNSEKEQVYKSEIARLKGRAKDQKEKPEVITVLRDNPEVGKYAAFLDSIVVTQDLRIDSLNKEKAEQWRNFNKLISTSDSVNTANIQLNKHFQSSLEEAKEANKKLTRQNRGLKIGIVAIPVAIGIIVLTK